MPRSENQKLKLLYLKQFFEEKTDENHTATTPEMIAYLHAHEVEAERKSIYSDLRALKAFGMVLRKEEDEEKERVKEFTYSNRPFQLREVKLIIDSVASSKFLSEKKSDELIKKLGTLVSEHQRKELRRQVRVMGRAKSMNESSINVADHIHAAMVANTTVRFKYFHYNLKKERVYSREGRFYEVSPWALLYDNDNYYLYAFVDDDFRIFRVDRMAAVSKGENKRQGKEAFEKMDLPAFSKSTFGMFNGKLSIPSQNEHRDRTN